MTLVLFSVSQILSEVVQFYIFVPYILDVYIRSYNIKFKPVNIMLRTFNAYLSRMRQICNYLLSQFANFGLSTISFFYFVAVGENIFYISFRNISYKSNQVSQNDLSSLRNNSRVSLGTMIRFLLVNLFRTPLHVSESTPLLRTHPWHPEMEAKTQEGSKWKSGKQLTDIDWVGRKYLMVLTWNRENNVLGDGRSIFGPVNNLGLIFLDKQFGRS